MVYGFLLYCSPHSYHFSNYCDSNSFHPHGKVFSIASKEQQLHIAIASLEKTLPKEAKKIVSDKFTRSNRENSNIAIAVKLHFVHKN